MITQNGVTLFVNLLNSGQRDPGGTFRLTEDSGSSYIFYLGSSLVENFKISTVCYTSDYYDCGVIAFAGNGTGTISASRYRMFSRYPYYVMDATNNVTFLTRPDGGFQYTCNFTNRSSTAQTITEFGLYATQYKIYS